MTCFPIHPTYSNPPFRGIAFAANQGDGYTIALRWFQAFSPSLQYQVAYNIYYSTTREDVFSEGVKHVALDPTVNVDVNSFTPGDMYYFAVRGTLFEIANNKLTNLPIDADGLYLYPEVVLLSDVGINDTSIPVSDPDELPPYGVIQLGHEIMIYGGIDYTTSSLVITQRGAYGTNQRLHNTDGYDGYYIQDPLVYYFSGFNDGNTSVIAEENKFFEPNYPRTNADGYRERTTDLLTTNLSINDTEQMNFQSYDYTGYHRTDPVALLSGECVGSYYGGEYGCADGYGGVGQKIRGISTTTANDQRQEELLSLTGEPMVLCKRLWTGITCYCVDSSRETPEPRCKNCYGCGIVGGYQQFFFPRRSDGRLMVRIDPSVDDLIPQEAGLESTFGPNAWTLTIPGIKDRDFLIRFNKDDTEEFRYEVLNVQRNKILLNDFGGQKLTLIKVRKTDPIYMFRTFRNTATMPQSINTSIGMVAGPGGILPHLHSVVINENIQSLSQINQTTGISLGHSHAIINGNVEVVLGHTHVLTM